MFSLERNNSQHADYTLVTQHLHTPLFFKQTPITVTCQTSYTVKHVFIKCGTFTLIRKCFFNANNMKDLFENVNVNDILSFFERKLYQKYKIYKPDQYQTKYPLNTIPDDANISLKPLTAQSAEAVECTNCFSAEG